MENDNRHDRTPHLHRTTGMGLTVDGFDPPKAAIGARGASFQTAPVGLRTANKLDFGS